MTQMNRFPGLGALTTVGPPRMTLKNSYSPELMGQNHVPSARQQSEGCAAADAVGALRAVLQMGEVAEKPSGAGQLVRGKFAKG